MNTLEKWRKHKSGRDAKYKDVKLSNKNKARLKQAVKDTFLGNELVGLNTLFVVTYGLEMEQMYKAPSRILDLVKKEKR